MLYRLLGTEERWCILMLQTKTVFSFLTLEAAHPLPCMVGPFVMSKSLCYLANQGFKTFVR